MLNGVTVKKSPKNQEEEFNELLSISIDEALSSLGENAKASIYSSIAQKFKIQKSEIPNRLDDFVEAIEAIFGPGSKHLEILFMQKLYSKVKRTCGFIKTNDFTFPKYVRAVKKNLKKKNSEKKKTVRVDIGKVNDRVNDEGNFIALLNLIADPAVVVDKKGLLIVVNAAFETYTGFTKKAVVGTNFLKLNNLDKKSQAILVENLRKRQLGLPVEPYEITFTHHITRETGYCEVNAKEITYSGQFADLVIFRDITQRKKNEMQLKEYTEKLEWLVDKKAGEIAEKEAKLRGIFDSSPDAIVFVDQNGIIVECNQTALKLFEYSKAELIGKNFDVLFGNKYREKINGLVQKTIAFGGARNVEYTFLTKDGREVPGELSYSVIKDNQGNITGYVGTTREITERKKMEDALKQERDMLESVTENIGAGIVMISKDYKILWMNNYLKQFTGASENNHCYSSFNTCTTVCPDCGPKKIFEGTPFDHREYCNQTEFNKDHPVWFELIATPIKDKDGNVVAALELTVNITEKKNMEAKLAEYSQELEKQVEERTRQLQQTQAKLVKSERLAAIGELAGMVGHDLRNPLTSIKGAAYFLKTKHSAVLDATGKDMLATIDNSIDYSNKIINDLLDYSKDIKLEFAEATPKALLKNALSLVEVPKRIKIADATQDTPIFKADTGKINRVFVNLIKNAIDAMPENGTLTITSRKAKNNVEIVFEDNGVGMTPETLSKLWTPLFTTKAKGMGFGLAICKRIIEAHRGKICVESITGKGTTFIVSVPVDPPPATEVDETWVFSDSIEAAAT